MLYTFMYLCEHMPGTRACVHICLQVPCLTIDGEEFFQSASIMRHVARYFGSPLYPNNAKVAAVVDSLMDQIKDMDIGRCVASYKRRFGLPEAVLNNDNAELVFSLWKTETLPRHLSFHANYGLLPNRRRVRAKVVRMRAHCCG